MLSVRTDSSLQHILIFGIKGVAATLRKDLSLNDWVGLVLKCGEINLTTMELLTQAIGGSPIVSSGSTIEATGRMYSEEHLCLTPPRVKTVVWLFCEPVPDVVGMQTIGITGPGTVPSPT